MQANYFDWKHLALSVMLLLSLVTALFLYSYGSECNIDKGQLERKISRFAMYYDEKYLADFKNGTVNGLAFGDFISVWTKDRSFEEVIDTVRHEYSHNADDTIHPEDCYVESAN